jgi:hypothetical protein
MGWPQEGGNVFFSMEIYIALSIFCQYILLVFWPGLVAFSLMAGSRLPATANTQHHVPRYKKEKRKKKQRHMG